MCTKFNFGYGLCPIARWGSSQRSRRTPSWIWGQEKKERGRREGKGWEKGGGKGQGRRQREGILLLPPHSTDPAYSPANAC